ncbi:MAG: sulfite exporter TauE/SafE family protein [Solibacillus sp.]
MLLAIGIIASMVGSMFGAAGLVTLPAMLLVGIPIHTTVAVNKFATGISAFTNVLTFLIKKQITFKSILPLILTATFGGVVGAFLATRLSEQLMNIIACILLIFALIIVITSKQFILNGAKQDNPQPTNLIAPFIISIYDGGFGPGSASMSITYYLKKQYLYLKAVEFSRIIIFSSCFGAFWLYLWLGLMDWGVAIPIAIGSIIGSHLGLKLLPLMKMKWLQVILPIIFALLILQIIIELLF